MSRKAYRAGSFYPDSKKEINSQIQHYLSEIDNDKSIPDTVKGGIVPHAGWVFSGTTALRVYQSIKNNETNNSKNPVFIIFGAVHVRGVRKASIYNEGKWETPIGEIEIEEHLAEMILDIPNMPIEKNEYAHNNEHSIEVQIPMIKYMFPNSKIIPIMTPPIESMKIVGEKIGTLLSKTDNEVYIIGSTDLTHYGPRFGFVKGGLGKKGLEWMKSNDQRIIDIMLNMKTDKVITETSQNKNACGGGAVLATLSALNKMGAVKAQLLEHTTSYDVRPMGEPSDAVGYAGIVYHL